MKIEIKEISPARLRSFIRVPYKIYKDHPYWVPPLNHTEKITLHPNRNTVFDHCEAKYWVAKIDGKSVGRIAGINHSLEEEYLKKKGVRFGWFDTINNFEVAANLVETVENWAKSKNAEMIHGPLGFTDLDKEGLLVNGFNELGTSAALYNHAYYKEFLTRLGYKKIVDWVEYEIKIPEQMPERVTRLATFVADRYELKKAIIKGKKDLKKYVRGIFEVLNISYTELYGFIPLNNKQIDFYADLYINFIQPDYVSIITDKKDKVIAFGITLPSLSKALQKAKGNLYPIGIFHLLGAMKRVNRADGYLIGILPEYQKKGINALMIHSVFSNLSKKGIRLFESGIHLETNEAVLKQWRDFEFREHKRRRCFIKQLT